MSDTAILVTVSSEELQEAGQMPGELRSLRNKIRDGGRVVHVEVITDAPLPEGILGTLNSSGAQITILPSASDTTASLVGGLMTRLHELITCYPHLDQILLADAATERLVSPAAFLQKAGYTVIVAGTERARVDAVRPFCDQVVSWNGGNRNSGKGREGSQKLDPYEVLVEEVTKGRSKGNRVLLTSLKQRIRKRIRRFDETRLKDEEGKPMKQFKDFVTDAVNRGLIQLVEKGNASHVLLPDEEIPEDEEEAVVDTEEETAAAEIEGASGDPLLDSVDSVGEPSEPKVEADIPTPAEKDFEVDKINEEAEAPPQAFMTFLDNMLPAEGLALGEMLHKLQEAREAGHLEITNRELKSYLQNAFHNELLEPANDGDPVMYIAVDDWKDIINFL